MKQASIAEREVLIEVLRKNNLTLIPLKKNEKKPLVIKWTSLSKDKLNEEFDLTNFEGNIGIRIEHPLFVVDVDDAKLLPLIMDEVNSNTWIVKTRRGFHIYLKARNYYPQTNKKGKLIQLLAEGCQAVAPPSVVEGHEYHFAMNPFETDIAEVDEKVVKRIEKIINVLANAEAFITKFSQIWVRGHRHNLSLWLNGALRKSGIGELEASIILKTICLLAEDPEIKDRLRTLVDTYEKPVEEIGGWSYLRRELESIVGPEQAAEILKLFPVKVYEEVKKEAAEKPRVKYVVGGEIIEGHVFELVDDAGTLKLLVYDPLTCGLQVSESLKMNSFVFKPYPELPFKEYLPGVPGAISEDPSLWRDTLEFIREYYDNPRSDDVYHVMTAIVAWSFFCNAVKGSTTLM